MEITIDVTRIVDHCLEADMASVPIIVGRLSLDNVEQYVFEDLGDGTVFRFIAETP